MRPGALPTSVQKALRLLLALTPTNRPMSLTRLTRAAGLSRSSGHRLAVGLAEAGLLRFHPDEGTYSLGLGLIDLAWVILETSPVRRAALSPMATLSTETGLHVSLAIPDEVHMVVLERLWAQRRHIPPEIRASWLIGARLPMLYSATGRAYLAHLEPDERDLLIRRAFGDSGQIALGPSSMPPWSPPSPQSRDQILRGLAIARKCGFGYQDSELASTGRAIASPIIGRRNRPVATLALLWFETDLSVDQVARDSLGLLTEATRQISETLERDEAR